MALRVAAVTSFVVFAVCLVAGADNTFGTAVGRALEAMAATLGVGLIVGWMGQKMIDENVKQHMKAAINPADAPPEVPAVKSDNDGGQSAVKKVAGSSAKRGR